MHHVVREIVLNGISMRWMKMISYFLSGNKLYIVASISSITCHHSTPPLREAERQKAIYKKQYTWPAKVPSEAKHLTQVGIFLWREERRSGTEDLPRDSFDSCPSDSGLSRLDLFDLSISVRSMSALFDDCTVHSFRTFLALSRCSNSFQVLSASPYPFHLTRNSFFPFIFCSPSIRSTSYSSTPSTCTGIGLISSVSVPL